MKRRILLLSLLLGTTAHATKSVPIWTYFKLEKKTAELEHKFACYSLPHHSYGRTDLSTKDKNGRCPLAAVLGKDLFFDLRDNKPDVTKHIQNKLIQDYGEDLWAWAAVWMFTMDAQFREESVFAHCLRKGPPQEVQSDLDLYSKNVKYLLSLFGNATWVDDFDCACAAENIYFVAMKLIGQYLGMWCRCQNVRLFKVSESDYRLSRRMIFFRNLVNEINHLPRSFQKEVLKVAYHFANCTNDQLEKDYRALLEQAKPIVCEKFPGSGFKFFDIEFGHSFNKGRNFTSHHWIDWVSTYDGLKPMVQGTKVFGDTISLGKCTLVDPKVSEKDSTNWQWEVLDPSNKSVGFAQFVQRDDQFLLKLTRTSDNQSSFFSINDTFCHRIRFDKWLDDKGHLLRNNYYWRAQRSVLWETPPIQTLFAMSVLKELGFMDGDVSCACFDSGVGRSEENAVILKNEKKNKRKKTNDIPKEIPAIEKDEQYKRLLLLARLLNIYFFDIDWITDDGSSSFKLKVERCFVDKECRSGSAFFRDHRVGKENFVYLTPPTDEILKEMTHEEKDRTQALVKEVLKIWPEVKKTISPILRDAHFVEKYKSLWKDACKDEAQWTRDWEEYKKQVEQKAHSFENRANEWLKKLTV